MAGVINKPDALSLSGNMNEFLLSSFDLISFVLKKGDQVLMEQSYEPGPDRLVRIDLRDVIEGQLSYKLDASQLFYVQPNLAVNFTAIVDGTEYSFRVIRTGVANLADMAASWLKLHFLTWQPRVKPVTYYSPEWLTYYAVEECTVKLKATYPNKSTKVISLGTCVAGHATTMNLQYSVVAGKLGNTYPSFYEVWTEKSGGTKLSESQVYAFSDMLSEDEQWYLFENSLGGLDTFRAYGSNNLNAEHEHSIAQFGDVREEYEVDTQRKYVKNTGYLDDYSRRWLLDFFPSKAKFVYEATAIRKIVVTESDVTYVSNELPSSYTFTWQLAEVSPFLNLVKNSNDIPDNLVAPDLSSPDFILPPRLAEFPRVQLTEGVLIPAFDPFNPKPSITTYGAIHNTIKNAVVKELEDEIGKIGGGSGGGAQCNIEIIKLEDITQPTDENVFSSLRTLKEIEGVIIEANDMFLRKDIDDTAHGNITFDQKIASSVFLDGYEGKGWEITGAGAALLDSARVRSDIYLGGRIGSPSFASGFPNGWGWDLAPYKRFNAAEAEETKYRLELDDLIVRGKLRVFEMIISQLRGENDNFIFAGQMKVAYYDQATNRLYLDTDKGILYNPFRTGDILMVQRFGGLPSAGNNYNVIKQYELRVVDAGVGSLTDGEDRLDWVTFSNFVGELSDIAVGDVLTRVDSVTDSTRKGIVKVTTIDEIGAPYLDVVYGLKTDQLNSTKARFGNLTGIRTKNNVDLSGVWGLYAHGAVLENSSIYLNNGMTVEQTFTVMNGELNSKIEGVKNDMSLEAGNILRNSSFGTDLSYWTSKNVVHFIDVGGRYLWMDGAFYTEKSSVADIYQDGSKNVLRLRNTTITQSNSVFNGDKSSGIYSFSFFYKVIKAGTLSVGFKDKELYISEVLSETNGYQKLSKVGEWDGVGDFSIGFTGEILIYSVSFYNDALADAKIKLQTQITQNAEEIALKASKDYVDTETGQIYIHYDSKLSVTAEKISAISTKVDNINNTIDKSGWITQAQGNTFFASKTLENGNKIISYINQTATTTTISSSRINLRGAVTIQMFDPDLRDDFNNKADYSDITSALRNYVSNSSLNSTLSSYVLSSALSNYVTSNYLTTQLKNYATTTAANGYATAESKAIFDKLTDAMINGKTSILGGVISSKLLDVDSIFANSAYLGDFSIVDRSIYSTINTSYGTGKMVLQPDGGLYFNVGSNMYAGFGPATISASSGSISLLTIRNEASGTSERTCAKFFVGRSTDPKFPQIWLECIHDEKKWGWGSKFIVESRYMGDSNQMERTVINVGKLMTHEQLKKISGNPNLLPVYYDDNSGCLCFKY